MTRSLIQKIFLGLTAGLVVVNMVLTAQDLFKSAAVRRVIPYHFTGLIFDGLQNTLGDIKYVGYFTDRDQDNPRESARFIQGQFTLAPRVLDLNNLNRRFILFDCKDENMAWTVIQKIGAQPLKRNNFGIILAERSMIAQ